MTEFFIDKPYAQTLIDHNGETLQGVRLYGDSPDTACLQIRTFGPITSSRTGKHREAFSTVSLNATDLTLLISELRVQLARLQ